LSNAFFSHRISLSIVGDLPDKDTLNVLIFSVEHLETKRAKLDSHYQPRTKEVRTKSLKQLQITWRKWKGIINVTLKG
jgi:hypothetical protein